MFYILTIRWLETYKHALSIGFALYGVQSSIMADCNGDQRGRCMRNTEL